MISAFSGKDKGRGFGLRYCRWGFSASRYIAVLASVLLLAAAQFLPVRAAKEGASRGAVAHAHKLRIMSRAFTACGAYSQARLFAQRALEIAAEQGASDPELCACRLDLAYLYAETGQYDRAEIECNHALELQRKFYSERHPDVAAALKIMSGILLGQGRHEDARIALERAIEIMLEHHKKGAPAMASYEIAGARLLCEEGMLDAAESCYLKTLELLDASFGDEHAYTAKVRVEIAALYVRRQRYDQAERLAHNAVAVQQRVYGENHQFLIPAWLVMAHVHDHRGEHKQAREMIEKAQLVAGKKLEPAHPLARRLAREARTLGIRASK